MDVYQLYFQLLQRPETMQIYRELKAYYESAGMVHEASAFGFLIEQRFGKNEPPNLPPDTEGQ